MPPTVLLVTDRPAFEDVWRPALDQHGFQTRAVTPEAMGEALPRGGAAVVDAACDVYDEDELLASVGLIRALDAQAVVALPGGNSHAGIEDVLDDLTPGLVARGEGDVARTASALARRCDAARGRRFEYVTVSPRPNELLAILADGTAALLARPVAEDDDCSEVASIELGNDAEVATLSLGSGKTVEVKAARVAAAGTRLGSASNGVNGNAPIDGARLGARLRELRQAAGLTQAELARRTGIHRPNIARVEAGRHTPSLETLARLAAAIGVPTTHVLAEE